MLDRILTHVLSYFFPKRCQFSPHYEVSNKQVTSQHIQRFFFQDTLIFIPWPMAFPSHFLLLLYPLLFDFSFMGGIIKCEQAFLTMNLILWNLLLMQHFCLIHPHCMLVGFNFFCMFFSCVSSLFYSSSILLICSNYFV